MKALRISAALAALAAGIAGCGYTVGDPCTTASDCGKQICLQGTQTPGGYCTLPCGSDGRCPNGSTCVQNAEGTNQPVCFRSCDVSGDCRSGYACLPSARSGPTVCVGPGGF